MLFIFAWPNLGVSAGRRDLVTAEEFHWGGWEPEETCSIAVPGKLLSDLGTNCYSCMTGKNVCTDPPKIMYHQYLDQVDPKHWEGNLLSMKAYMLTQASAG